MHFENLQKNIEFNENDKNSDSDCFDSKKCPDKTRVKKTGFQLLQQTYILI